MTTTSLWGGRPPSLLCLGWSVVLLFCAVGCSDESATESLDPLLEGSYALVEENGQPLPADPFAPNGCCLTLSGQVTFNSDTYDLSTSHQNKNNGIMFENSEQGTYTRKGNTLSFTRTGGGGAGYPYLLGPGTVSEEASEVTLLYGDEGPGSNQISATFRR